MKNANPVSLRLALVLAILGAAGCDRTATVTAAQPTAASKTIADWFSIAVGDRVVRMQVAVTPAEQQRGLMERRDLGKDEGMLFVFAAPQSMNFWMKNTPTPLDIAYYTERGVLAEVYPAFPFDERTINSMSQRLQFVLEMNQGWYSANQVRPGAQLDLKAVAVAVRARGFNPGMYGLKE